MQITIHLIALCAEYKTTKNSAILDQIADIVESDYETLCPIMEKMGVSF